LGSVSGTINTKLRSENRYLAADTDEWNPNRVSKSCYNTEIDSTVNEVEEYIYQRVRQFVDVWGKPKVKTIFLRIKR